MYDTHQFRKKQHLNRQNWSSYLNISICGNWCIRIYCITRDEPKIIRHGYKKWLGIFQAYNNKLLHQMYASGRGWSMILVTFLISIFYSNF